MARFKLFLLVLLASSLSESRGQESGNFPLHDCHTGQFDVLIIYSGFDEEDFPEHLCDTITSLFVGSATKGRESSVSYVKDSSIKHNVPCHVFLKRANENATNVCERLETMASVNLNSPNLHTQLRSIIKLSTFVFTEMGVGRQNFTQVLIIIVNYKYITRQSDYEEIERIQRELQEEWSGMKVFVLFDLNFNIWSHFLIDMLFLSRRSDFKFRDHIVSLSLCKQCSPGWFTLRYTREFNVFSCFKLDVDDNNIDWFEASTKCQNIYANLVTIESEYELNFLQEHLFEHLLTNRQKITRNGVSHHNSTSVYIGLKRDSKTVAQRFQWELGNQNSHRPLVLNHWLDGKPGGGFSQACGVWLYDGIFQSKVPVDSIITNVSADWLTFSNYKSNNAEGWSDVGCGMTVTKLSLCELNLSINLRERNVLLRINPSNEESFTNALNRGDFKEYRGSIVSVSAYVNDEEFIEFLLDNHGEFPLFDCGDDMEFDRYIAYYFVCDRVDHCSNRHDESMCNNKHCITKCRSGQCIPDSARCDMFKDCDDGSDEEDCEGCSGRRSCDGTCLPEHVCYNGHTDCRECKQHDNRIVHEFSLQRETTDRNETCAFICNRDQCIYPSQINDGNLHCTGQEGPLDETLGKLPRDTSCNNSLGHPMWAPECVYIKDRYGLALGCGDLSHLQDCENFTCQEGYVKCPGSYCIPLNYVVDGKSDCPMGEEERARGNHRCIGNFACWNSKVCLHPDLVCDGHVDCPYKDDELSCNVSCPEGIRCVAGTVTIEKSNSSIKGDRQFMFNYPLRYLDLSGVDLSKTDVSIRGTSTVIEIKLSSCQLLDFPILFESYLDVYKIDLSYNHIRYKQTKQPLKYLYSLQTLNLSFNEQMVEFVMYKLFDLETLDLSHTGLSYLDIKCCYFGQKLKHLNLSHTQITTINKHHFFVDFTLETLDLRGAPITQFSENTFNGLIIRSSLYADNFGLCCPQVRGQGIPGHTCHATEDAISSCFDLIGGEVQRVLLWLVGVISIVGNLIVIVYRLIWDRSVLKKAYGLFVLNLAISDLIMGLYLLMIAGADVYYRGMYVLYDKIWKESLVCKTAGFLATLSSETSTFFILLITVDRFLVLKFPYRQRKFSRTTKIIAVVLTWGIGFPLAFIPVLPIFGDQSIFASSSMCIGLPLTNERVSGWEYSFSVFIVLNFIMFLIIAFGQAAIFRSMSDNRMSNEATNQYSLRRAQNINVAKELSLVVLSNFLCWFPVGFMGLLSLSGHEFSKDVYAWTVVLVLPVNSALNPLLYTIPVLMTKWEKFKHGDSTPR